MSQGTDLDKWLDSLSADIDKWELKTGRTFLGGILTSHERGWLERYFDKHNHKMAGVRTITSALAIILSTIILYKVW
jgi:hypothetical protein